MYLKKPSLPRGLDHCHSECGIITGTGAMAPAVLLNQLKHESAGRQMKTAPRQKNGWGLIAFAQSICAHQRVAALGFLSPRTQN